MFNRLLIAGALSLASLSAWAQVTVAEPWIRATVASQMATGAFMKITAASPSKLVGASCPVAGVVEVHEMALELPAGRTVELKPGGYHVMLMDLKRDLKEGETVPLTLVIEQGGKRQNVELKVVVLAPTARGAAASQGKH